MFRIAGFILALWAVAANGQSFRERLQEGHEFLRAGNVEQALLVYRDLQVDEPDSDVLAYNMGLAHFRSGQDSIQAEAFSEAGEALTQAKSSFEKGLFSRDRELRRASKYNLANTLVKEAALAEGTGDYEGAVDAYEKAIERYDQLLDADPNHQAARKNRAHARYKLKKLLQNPPPPQEEQQGDGEQESDDQQEQDEGGEQQEQKQQEGDSGEQEGTEGEEPQEQQGQQDAEQQGEGEQKEPESSGEPQQREGEQEPTDESQAPPEEDDEQRPLDELTEAEEQGEETAGTARQSDMPTPEPQREETIEALLESIEEMDNRLQHDVRSPNRRGPVPMEWW